ncbi:hypothetical protein DFO67_10716 [Modicisalibacter xianhensis]|uniref:Uncharacterized protein n=1 Tax=Modicisalibacter xianhensis TaxID=442341 RepID=A0A4R8FYW2_9GAMM|nr:hypothetical protein [Halomonas xianhensis]TDX29340.1 hypothetical protein DFO67_10716 [Halomonas xianhensis]
MFEAYEFPATSQHGESVTLIAFLQFNTNIKANGEAAYRLGPIHFSTMDGRPVDYHCLSGQFFCREGCETFTTDDEVVLNLLKL